MYDDVYKISIRISTNRLVTVNLPEGDPVGHSHEVMTCLYVQLFLSLVLSESQPGPTLSVATLAKDSDTQ